MVDFTEGDQHPESAETKVLQPSDIDNSLVIDHQEAGQPANAMEAALTAAILGHPVFPCAPDTKRPLIKDWPNQATRDEEMIVHWWTYHPEAMVGAVTGLPSGNFVIDIDVKDGVDAKTKLEQLEAKYGALHPKWMVSTPSGGLHLYCELPAGQDVTNSTSKLAPNVDIRGTGGYVIFAGSTRFDGKKYCFVTEA